MTVATKLLAADGEIVGTGAKVLGVHYIGTTTIGVLQLKDGGSGGTVKIDLNTPAVVGSGFISIGGGGIVFDTDVYLNIDANVTSVTVIYAS